MVSRSEYGRGSSRHVVRSKRSYTNIKGGRPGSGKVSSRHRPAEDEITRDPDVDELRRIRSAYFGRPYAERRRTVVPREVEVIQESTRPSKSVKSSSSGERRHKTSSHKSGSDSSSRRSSKKEPRRRLEEDEDDFVYPARVGPVTEEVEVIREIPRHRSSQEPSSRRYSETNSSRRRRRPSLDLPDQEVTPDDSISQVAERNYQASRAQRHASTRRSQPPRRHLDPVVEVEYEPQPRSNRVVEERRRESIPSATPNRRHYHTSSSASSKRESNSNTILGSFFRRPSQQNIPPISARLVECLTCGADDVPSTRSAKLACGHRICHSCLKRVFELSVVDPAHMPPKCCTEEHIPLRHVDKLFDLKFKKLWNRKYQEYHTKKRIYCPQPKCGEWIKPNYVRTWQGRKFAQCPRCKTKVCTICNNKMHRSRECPQDPEIARLVEQAKEQGWQRCYRCQAMVELKEGCNHMTCRCQAEFCMLCGAKWKTCECPWFNYTTPPDDDQLNEMRVPEPIQVLFRRVVAEPPRPLAAGPPPPPQPPLIPHPRRRQTYNEEMAARQRQERLDEELAHRVQLATLMDDDDAPPLRRRVVAETWGLGNAAGHFMNDNYVREPTNTANNGYGEDEAGFGRRGERAAGRRRRAPRQSVSQQEQNRLDPGLAPGFLGDESVLGFGALPARPRMPGAW